MRVCQNFDDFLEKVRNRFSPEHFGQIVPEDARAWWLSLDQDATHDEDWHLNRLGNPSGVLIGGSEIGALVAAALREPPPFGKTLTDLFAMKLMRQPLVPSNTAMQFGTKREDQARAAFEALVSPGIGWERDNEGLSLISDYAKHGKFRSNMAYSPDDLFIDENGLRVLVDYKVPYSGVVPERVPLGYAAQLHQGQMVFDEQIGLSVDRMILVVMQHRESLAKPAENQLRIFELPHDSVISGAIRETAPLFAHAVSCGEPSGLLSIVLSLESQRLLGELDREMLQLRMEKNRIEGCLTEVANRMSEMVSDMDPAAARSLETVAKPAFSVKVKKEEELERFLTENGDDPAMFKESVGLDIKKLEAALLRDGFDLAPFRIEKFAVKKLESSPDFEAMLQHGVERAVSWRVSAEALQTAALQTAALQTAVLRQEDEAEPETFCVLSETKTSATGTDERAFLIDAVTL